jgi:biotin carboxyl carrier protein
VAGKWTLAVLALAFLFVLMPFLFWQSTWFGRPLTDAEIETYLADRSADASGRKAQHALSQIADRMVRGDASVRRWYPQVAALAKDPAEEIRLTAAWVMGQDNRVPEFHEALAGLLADANPMVRRNAALSLVRFADASGRPELRAMLGPYAVPAPRAGALVARLRPGDAVNPGTLLGRLRRGEEEHEVRSPVPGTLERWLVADGAPVEPGQEIVSLAPSPEMVFEALRALVLVGLPEDLPLVERYRQPGVHDRLRQQAELTARALRQR